MDELHDIILEELSDNKFRYTDKVDITPEYLYEYGVTN